MIAAWERSLGPSRTGVIFATRDDGEGKKASEVARSGETRAGCRPWSVRSFRESRRTKTMLSKAGSWEQGAKGNGKHRTLNIEQEREQGVGSEERGAGRNTEHRTPNA